MLELIIECTLAWMAIGVFAATITSAVNIIAMRSSGQEVMISPLILYTLGPVALYVVIKAVIGWRPPVPPYVILVVVEPLPPEENVPEEVIWH
jgi:hypothetical protein